MGAAYSAYTLIAGLGKTGQSIARYLEYKKQPYVLCDTREFSLDKLSEVKEIIASPGVPLDTALFQKARELGIKVIGDIECLAQESKAPMIAITGTNGKSTVTTLVGEMARVAGKKVIVAGNIGEPVLDCWVNSKEQGIEPDLWVLELSSFQLDLTDSLSPAAATILNITPDHLDRHHHMQAYIDAKHRIYHRARVKLYNRSDLLTKPKENQCNDIFCSKNKSTIVSFGLDDAGDRDYGIRVIDQQPYLVCQNRLLMPIKDMLLKGQHNWENALAACALSLAVGIPQEACITVLKQFSGLEHRSQWVRRFQDVDYINDSKGTNVGATLSAIGGIGPTLTGKIILIAGGLGKGADFAFLRPAVERHVRSLILLGKDAPLIAEAMADSVPITFVDSMDEAVKMSAKLALTGDVVLLSPACASLDMFRDYRHRGDVFTSIVKAL